jgi:hypothetical protein
MKNLSPSGKSRFKLFARCVARGLFMSHVRGISGPNESPIFRGLIGGRASLLRLASPPFSAAPAAPDTDSAMEHLPFN